MTQQTQRRIRAIIITPALVFGVALAAASVAGETDPPSRRVSYADLNLSTAAGAKVLYSRLRDASNTVCGNFENSSLPLRIEWQRCFDQALRNAVLKVNSPQFSERYGIQPKLATLRGKPAG